MNQVRLYHPVLDAYVSTPETAVDIHRASGWIPADEYVPPVEEPGGERVPDGAGELADESSDEAAGAVITDEKKPTSKAAGRRQTQEQ